MRVRYLGKSDPLMLLNGKVYDVISVEGDWYRIVDETGEDYLYPPQVFEIVEPNDGSVPEKTLEESMKPVRPTSPFAPEPLLFEGMSLRGRFAYAAICFEAKLLSIDPSTDWTPLMQILWEFADGLIPWDTWIDHVAGTLPSTFEECPNFNSYRLAGYGSEESEYAELNALVSKLDDDGKGMLEDFFEMIKICEGTSARHAIKASEGCFMSICMRLSSCEAGFPSLEEVAFLPDIECDGYGRPFNGTVVSRILELRNYSPFDFPNHCLKCGGEVTITREAIYLTATCDDCGEIAITTYIDPIDEDSTKYALAVEGADKVPLGTLKTLGKITSLNYLQLKTLLESGSMVVCEGLAREIAEKVEMLQSVGITYAIHPEYPYPIPYEGAGEFTESRNVVHSNRRFSKAEESLLKRMKGSKLLTIDAVLAAPPDNSWNTVRLHFEGFDIDVSNFLSDIVVDEFGTLEEFGLLSISEATKEVLDIPEVGADTTVFKIGETVEHVTVVNDIADIYGDGTLVAKLEYPQAIALHTESGVIMLDKEVWFSEMIVIKRGKSVNELLYDESVNWEDDPEEDPTTHFEFRTETQRM